MPNIDEIYNQALEMLRAGSSRQEILARFAGQADELAPLLEISAVLSGMPKNIVPTPLMQRKYSLSRGKLWWLNWGHAFKLAAASSAFVLLAAAGVATAYAAVNSLPGHSLFALKRAAEKAELDFTLNPQAKANLEIALAQKRLAEAQQVFGNPGQNDQQSQAAALAELASQTNTAVAAAASVAQTNPQAQSNPPLLNSLEKLARQQQSLLKQIKPDGQVQAAAQNALAALNNSNKQISQIKEAISVADSGQALAQLTGTSTAVTALGDITQASATAITVDKVAFAITPQTAIADDAGNQLTAADLTAGSKVNVLANQQQNALVAEQITLIAPGQTAAATSSTSTMASVATSSPSSATSTAGEAQKVEAVFTDKPSAAPGAGGSASATAPTAIPGAGLNIATGGFIIETPEPQYHP